MKSKVGLQIAKEAYKSTPDKSIDGWELIDSTNTLKFYKKGNDIKVGVRGTHIGDPSDLSADALLAFGQLKRSGRYKKDVGAINEIQKKYPANRYHYSATGHSLGGAVIDSLLRDKLIQSGESYNPAVEPQNLGRNLENERVYSKDDPLYQLMGSRLKYKPEVRQARMKDIWERYTGKIGNISHSLKSHGLTEFDQQE